jgi:glutathione synthase/RimK-type ligase-like ATP-grasp enzyme
MNELTKLMKKNGGNTTIIGSKYDKENEIDTGIWHYNIFKDKIPNLRFCYFEDNKNSRSHLTDITGKTFKPDTIYKYKYPLSSSFDKKALVINPTIVEHAVTDKVKCLDIAEKTGVKFPFTVIVKNTTDVKRIMKKNPNVFKTGYVIKPIDKWEGIGVHVLKKGQKIPRINEKELLEQRIIPRLHHNCYWDVRILVVNGKYLGGYVREDESKVTNVSRGAHTVSLPSKTKSKLRKPSLKIVKAIDQYATEKLRKI